MHKALHAEAIQATTAAGYVVRVAGEGAGGTTAGIADAIGMTSGMPASAPRSETSEAASATENGEIGTGTVFAAEGLHPRKGGVDRRPVGTSVTGNEMPPSG